MVLEGSGKSGRERRNPGVFKKEIKEKGLLFRRIKIKKRLVLEEAKASRRRDRRDSFKHERGTALTLQNRKNPKPKIGRD